MPYKNLTFPNSSVFLVTGGAGFIGSNLCEAILNLGYQVRCLDDLSTGSLKNTQTFAARDGYTFIKGSVTDLDVCKHACEGVDYVLHEAAWGSVPRSIEMPLYYEEVNIKGTLNMMEAARCTGVKKFVYASSSSVYGDHPVLPKVEGQEGKTLSPYALTKRVNEEYGRLYYQLYGLDTYGLRYFNVFGRRQNPDGAYAAVIPKFIKALLSDTPPVIHGDGTQSRDFTYIENVIEANLRACQAGHELGGEIFNVAYGGRESILSVYTKLCDLLGKNIKPEFCPPRAGDIQHSNADISKARKLIGYAPEYDFDRGLAEAINWYCENLGNEGELHMKVTNTALPGIKILEPKYFNDFRGYFCETYSKRTLAECGIQCEFVQDNHSLTLKKGTIRGLHFQNNPHAQSKLVRCVRGRILDVAVDLRKGSATYQKWISIELSAENHRQLWIPAGFGHGFVTLEDICEVQYKVDEFYYPDCDRGIAWNDAEIGIDWGIDSPIVSEKDANSPPLCKSDVNFTLEENR